MCGMVVIESVTLLLFDPAGSDEGLNVALAFAGNPEALNEIALPKVPLNADGATASMKLPGCPATTEDVEGCVEKLKSGTTIASAGVAPPPGAGLITVTLRTRLELPEFTKSPAGICAESDVALTMEVASEVPLTRILELALKFVPVTVAVCAALPGATICGERLVRAGMGLFTVNVVGTDAVPLEFCMYTSGHPPTATSLAGTDTVRAVED